MSNLPAQKSVDPFADSGSLDLFSGLKLSGPENPLSSGPPESARSCSHERLAPRTHSAVNDFDASRVATVARSESGSGLDLLGIEDDMLVEATLRSEGAGSLPLCTA